MKLLNINCWLLRMGRIFLTAKQARRAAVPEVSRRVVLSCHVCCVCVQVDLRGFLGERSWLRPILDALGWVDAYVERMLMAVILVKDEVRVWTLSWVGGL
jgi:hypothetical protein